MVREVEGRIVLFDLEEWDISSTGESGVGGGLSTFPGVVPVERLVGPESFERNDPEGV